MLDDEPADASVPTFINVTSDLSKTQAKTPRAWRCRKPAAVPPFSGGCLFGLDLDFQAICEMRRHGG